jgi:dTDP-4-dehydrorhamnose reductase
LVTGAGGQVGSALVQSLAPLGQVIALTRRDCDLARPAALPRIVGDVAPDVIVNAGAYTAVDRAETEEALATTVNGEAPGVLAAAARASGALFVHYSTDYVFDGAKAQPYTEDDPPHPINAYGRSKLAGEQAIARAGGRYLVLRTSWVYAARGHNFIKTVLRLARERDELRIVADQIGAPTWARDIAQATARIVEQAGAETAGGSFRSAILNLSAAGETSWHGFAEAVAHEAQARGLIARMPAITSITSADYPTPAARPKNSRLAGERLRARYGIALPDWREALARCMNDPAVGEPA